jgi:hypothetical protein
MWHVWETEKLHTEFWWGNLRERDHVKDLGTGRKITLKCIFKKRERGHGLDSSGSEYGQVSGCCECYNEHSGSIKCGAIS